ncbi:discoidin domain-containing protein [bacterium]|nr:discoidin domain-containing protein [bacterium]
MNCRLLLLFYLLTLISLAWGKGVLLISSEENDFTSLLKDLDIPFSQSPSLSSLKDLPQYDALILCSLNYPEPNFLREEDESKIKSFLENGGRVFMEYSTSINNTLFGMKLDNPKRMLHERLIVSESHFIAKDLEVNTLLDEHNSAFLSPLQFEGEPIIHYGKVLGTYKLFKPQDWIEINLDLGEIHNLSLYRQRFGASIADYCPEKVEVYLSEDGMDFRKVGQAEGNLLGQIVEIPLSGGKARYVKIKVYKYRRSPTTDWLFLGEMEILDENGENIALRKSYTLSPSPPFPYSDVFPGKLTDGIIEGHYSDKLSVGFPVRFPPSPLYPAIVALNIGKGELIIAFLKISDYKRRFFRPSEKWEILLKNIILFLLPDDERARIEESYIPLKVWSEPRKWVVPGEKLKIIVRTEPEVSVKARQEEREIKMRKVEGGFWEGELSLNREGNYEIKVVAMKGKMKKEGSLKIEVKAREKKYLEVLDRNINWFLRSGVMPKGDGSEGVYNQRCIAWFDGGPLESLPSPYRVDCNAKSALAFYLYGKLTKNEKFKMIAEKIIDFMLPHQISDPNRHSFGGWTWLYEKINTIWFWDDNTRTALCLLYLYKNTGKEKFLIPALRTLELCRRVAHPDGLITRTAVEPEELDKLGCSAYRRFQQGIASDFDLLRWFSAYAITGDEEYKRLAETCLRCWKHISTVRGLPVAYFYTMDEETKKIIINYWQSYLENPDVKRWGVPRVDAPDYLWAFEGDCSITTAVDDPLSDQLYQTSFLLLHSWWSYKATGESVCLSAFHKIGDFLARIQMESEDKRIDGAWVRGWDLENWECFGAPYDPNYGPYSAYTGWMNSIIDIAYSLYLLNENPFSPPRKNERALSILKELRATAPQEGIKEENIALNRPYTLTPAPEGEYGDSPPGKLTDGLIDGHYEDGLSVGWHIDEGKEIAVEMVLDLGEEKEIAMVAQRYGAGEQGYIPDEVVISASKDGANYIEIGRTRPQIPGFLYIPLSQPVKARYLKFFIKKARHSPTTDFLFIGETLVYPKS